MLAQPNTDKKTLTVTTFNIHKGMSALNKRVNLHEMACALERLSPDLIMLQEVQGKNSLRASRHSNWTHEPHHNYLARKINYRSIYGLNSSHNYGHHGNAILSRFPLQSWLNLNISVNRFEHRGLLICRVQVPNWVKPIWTLCGHFNLLGRDRRKQYKTLIEFVNNELPKDVPLILAGDFNDWTREADFYMSNGLGLVEAFKFLHGHFALSFPARNPLLALDRIYIRGLQPIKAQIHNEAHWRTLSDHLPLSASFLPI